ncbi:hypothetical protein V6Z11_A12G104500 [Gossypium hirsutum]
MDSLVSVRGNQKLEGDNAANMKERKRKTRGTTRMHGFCLIWFRHPLET